MFRPVALPGYLLLPCEPGVEKHPATKYKRLSDATSPPPPLLAKERGDRTGASARRSFCPARDFKSLAPGKRDRMKPLVLIAVLLLAALCAITMRSRRVEERNALVAPLRHHAPPT